MLRLTTAAALVVMLAGCSLVFSGDAYEFGDASADGAIDSTAPTDGGVDGDDAALDAPPLDATVDGGAPPVAHTGLFGSANHSCATLDSELWCWGMNNLGAPEMGTNFATPGSSYVTGSVGIGCTCAIGATGEMACWGQNPDGRLGVGDTVARQVPTPIDGFWRRVSASSHTCAIASDQTVHCTGAGRGVRLGTGSPGRVLAFTPVTRAATVVLALDVAVGDDFSCVITDGGELVCWGDVGDFGPSVDSLPMVMPNFQPEGPWTRVCAGNAFLCVLNDVDELYCAGQNNAGQIGVSGAGRFESPQMVLTGVEDFTCGANHACAVEMDGRIACWGDNGAGQLGNGTRDLVAAGAIERTLMDSGYVAVRSGGPNSSTTCARDRFDAVWCWGQNDLGQADPTAPGGAIVTPTVVTDPRTL